MDFFVDKPDAVVSARLSDHAKQALCSAACIENRQRLLKDAPIQFLSKCSGKILFVTLRKSVIVRLCGEEFFFVAAI